MSAIFSPNSLSGQTQTGNNSAVTAGKRGTMLTRTQKKRAKNQRIAEAKGQDRQAKRINETAKAWAILLTSSKNPNEGIENRLGYCPTCEEWYCFNYAGGISWCEGCFWENSCLKRLEPIDPLITRECRPCRWEREDKENADAIPM